MKTIKSILSAIAVMFVVSAALTTTASAAVSEGSYQKAPAFTAVTLDGRQISSTSLKGKAYIVNFFASWCPPCRAEIPDMVALQKTYEAKGFTFIGIAVNESEPTIKNFIKSNGIRYPVVMANQSLVNAFGKYVEGGMNSIPTSFVIDSSGRLTGVIIGARSRDAFDQIIRASMKAGTK
jgi:peroxiredoxin